MRVGRISTPSFLIKEVFCIFLNFSKSRGNDLSTPRAEYNFPGLKSGDHWCICAERWKEAYDCGKAPKLFLKKSNKKALTIIKIEILKKFSLDLS